MGLLTLALVVLTTARLTRFITTDDLFGPVRRAVIDRLGPDSRISYLILCDWCVSVYAGAGVALAAWAWAAYAWFSVVTLALSASYVTGFLAAHTED